MSDAARAYEALFVPALFEQWTPLLAELAQLRPGERVLDVACGTGVLTRQVARRVGPSGHVVGLDPDPGMLAVAREKAPEIAWREGRAESLPFPDGTFDAVVSQFGLMFFTDRVRALREMLRVLGPRRRLVVAAWDELEKNPAYAAEVALLARLAGRPAADALTAPFAVGDPALLGRLFADAGAGRVELVTHRGKARFPSIRVMLDADLRGWLPLVGIVLGEDTIGGVLAAADEALAACVSTTPDGIEFDISAHVVCASPP